MNFLDGIDYTYLLIENYKKMGLSENEFTALLVIDHLLKQKNNQITPALLSLKMTLSEQEIDKVMDKLFKKGFLTFDDKLNTSIDRLKQELYKNFRTSVVVEQLNEEKKDQEQSLKNIYQQYEILLRRTLSPLEVSKISEWMNFYTKEQIVDALKDTLARDKKSFREIDKVLLRWGVSEDIKKEGYTARNEKWDKDIEETIRIAQLKWLDD